MRAQLLRRRARLAKQPLSLTVRKHRQCTPDLIQITLARAWFGPLPGFHPGQAIALVRPLGTGSSRWRYSLARWQKTARQYELLVRAVPGGEISNWVKDELTVGARVDVLPPVGQFVIDAHVQQVVLVAAGVGVTPLMAMLDALKRRVNPIPVHLLWSARDRSELVYRDELTRLAKTNNWFRYTLALTRPAADWRGPGARISTAQVRAAPSDPHTPADYYFCASLAMMQNLMEGLIACGVDSARLHHEVFSTGAQNDDEAEYAVTVSGDAPTTIKFQAEPSLLSALEKTPHAPEADCRTGTCGSCRMRIMQGTVRTLTADAYPVAANECLACCVVPSSDLVLARP